MRCFRTLCVLLIFLFPATQLAFAQKPSVSAQVSSKVVQVGQPFVLEYAIEGSIKNYDISKTLFNDFEMLAGPFESVSSGVVFNSQNNSVNKTSNISIQYKLSAKKAGNFTIPSISATSSKGEVLRSNTVTIRVLPGDAQPAPQRQVLQADPADLSADNIDQNLFIIAEVDNTNPYVGEQVNVTYKLYTILQMSMSPTSKPQLNGFWAYDEELPETSEPHQENYQGRRYNVFILRKTALFPQQAGNLVIDPVKASGWVLVKEPDFWGYYQDTRVNKEVQSPPVSVNVRPLPVFEGNFSGGVGHFSIAQHFSKTHYTTDDLIQLTVTINGNGNLGLISAPTLNLPQGLSAIAPEIKDEVNEIMPKLMGSRTFTFNISADAAGTYTIPAIAFSYYDSKEQRYQTLNTVATQLNIAEGKGNKTDDNAAVASDLKDILPIKTQVPGFSPAKGFVLHQWYYWLLLLIPVVGAILATSLGKKKRAKINNRKTAQAAPNTVAAQRLAAARTALSSGQNTAFFEEVSKAIWLYLSEQLNIPLSQLNRASLQTALEEKAIDTTLIQKTLQQIEACEMALYTPLQPQQQAHILSEAEDIIAKFETYFNSKK